MNDFKKEIWAHALKNAIEFGKTDAGKILPKLFAHGLDKKDIKLVMGDLQSIVKEVNSMKTKERIEKFKDYESLIPEKIEQEGLPELEGAVMGKVVTRLAPEPSKYNHIGHALVFLIQYLYAKKYKGKCILRFDDTNPEKSTKEYYDAMKEDLSWLGMKWDQELIASDDMKNMYKYAEHLIKEGHAYICSCTQEQMKDLREKKKECSCRKRKSHENLKEWDEMLEGKVREGEKTVRLKGDMKSNNGVMRDPVIFRISFSPHFIQKNKYCVWPMYDFENPIEDSLNGVTHVIRSKEFELRYELHKFILDLLKLKSPYVREIGRYQITGAETQGRKIREMIEKKEVMGWDDPRLVTIKALRRRGFVPQTFVELAQTVGLSKSSGHIDFSVLSAVNRKIIDPIALRFFFVENPVELNINKSPDIDEVEIAVHPDKPNEKRKLKVGEKIFISENDFNENKGKEIRLLHLFNVKLPKTGKDASFTSTEVKDVPKLQWVSDYVPVKILMDNGKWTSGFGEKSIEKLKVGDIIQFERNAFCRLDKIENNTYEFWFSHK